MSLRVIEPWANLNRTFNGSQWGGVNLITDYDLPLSILAGDSGTYARPVTLELLSDGWLRYTNTVAVSGNRYGGLIWNLPRRGIVMTADSVIYGGFRVRSSVLPLYVFGPMTTGGTYGVSFTIGLKPTDFPDGGMKVNTEYYVEWCVDVPNKIMRYRVDGVEVAFTNALTTAQITSILAGEWWVCYGGYTANPGYIMDFKDGYVTDKSADGIMSGWLGPQIVRKAPVLEATGPWTASTGTVKDALNAPITDSASRLTPLVTSDADATEEVLKFDFSSIQGKINGISVAMMTRRPQGKLGSAEITGVNGGNSSPTKRISPTLDMLSYPDGFVTGVAPDGTPWTKASAAATSFKIKPVT